MSEAQKGIPKGVTINLGSAGLAYTTSEGDQIISIKKSDYDKLSAENAALSERLREADKIVDIACELTAAIARMNDFQGKSHISIYGKQLHEALKAYLSKTPKEGG